MFVRRVRLVEQDVVLLGGILHGEDNLASIHGEPCDRSKDRVTVAVLTTAARKRELDAWLCELRDVLGLEMLD